MNAQLTPTHATTYEMIFRHPIARNLQWRNVRAMLEALSDSAEAHGDQVRFTRNGQTLLLSAPRRKDFSDVRALMDLRRFLERTSETAPAAPAEGTHLLVVIDHRVARVYRAEIHGSVPQRIVALNDGGAGRHLHYVQDDSNGQRKPEQRGFYDAVARTLENARSIVIFGAGTGASSAMDQLVAELREHHPQVAQRIVATQAVDLQHVTDDQLLARARTVYEGLAAAPAPHHSEAAD